MFIPPHVYASTYGARGTGSVSERAFWGDAASGMDQLLLGGSVVSGRGHTLKGRDALKMRTAILRQTGFVEPTMTALDAMNGGAGSFEGERVPRVPTPAIAPGRDDVAHHVMSVGVERLREILQYYYAR
jgi:hypothetical protein